LLTRNSRFNSPDFSDVTLLIYRAGEVTRIAAHKFVLTAGSRAFREYLQSQSKVRPFEKACGNVERPHADVAQVVRHTVSELPIQDVWDEDYTSIPPEAYEMVVRCLYGLPILDEDMISSTTEWTTAKWKMTWDAADGFGIPSLEAFALGKIEEILCKKLTSEGEGENAAKDTQSVANQFLDEMDTLLAYTSCEETKVRGLTARLCCENFSTIRQGDGEKLDSVICQYDLCLEMLDYVARHGNGALG
jgi:hypothetical protein